MNHLGEIASILTSLGVLANVVMTIWGNLKTKDIHTQNTQIIEATNGLLKRRIELERKDATAEGIISGRAEAKGEAKDRGDVRGKG